MGWASLLPGLDINSGEFLILIIIALVVIGPKRLPEYTEKLRTFIRQARDMAEGAKTQLKSEMGPEYQDIDWRQYDPRQYDPRKIVREALFDDPDANIAEELGLVDRAPGGEHTGATSLDAMASVGAAAAGVGASGVGAEGAHQPMAPASFVTNTYHPDRVTPFDSDAT